MHLSTTSLLVLAHVLTAVGLVCGIVGRTIVIAAAARSREIHTTQALMAVVGQFERRLVMPGSFLVLATGLVVAWVQGQPLLGVLEGSGANWLLISLLLYLSSVPLVALVFIPRGQVFEAALEDAVARQVVTPALDAAFADRGVALARTAELTAVLIVLALMVTKAI